MRDQELLSSMDVDSRGGRKEWWKPKKGRLGGERRSKRKKGSQGGKKYEAVPQQNDTCLMSPREVYIREMGML